jgi:hypothetical protein
MAFQWELGGSPPNPFPLDKRAPGTYPLAPPSSRSERALSRLVPRIAAALLLLSLFSPARSVCAESAPRFGDSTWVAPWAGIDGDPSAPGPRVAEPDGEKTWETVLRAPFRVAFFPLRVLARGTEVGISYGAKFVQPRRALYWQGIRIGPTFGSNGSAGPSAGVVLRGRSGFSARSTLKATWSVKDTRRVHLTAHVTERAFPMGVSVEGLHEYRPNRRFFGIGNDSRREDRSIYLRRENTAAVSFFVGKDSLNRARALFALSDIHIDGGYNGSGAHLAKDIFTPEEVPFLTEGSTVVSFGLGGDLAKVDRRQNPSRGIHFRGDGRRVESVDATDLHYYRWQAEGRSYLPVFAERRVIALRLLYEGVDPRSGSSEIPFYRLPEAVQEARFAGYSNHRFSDRQLLLGHAEYRWVIWRNLWATAFVEAGEVAPFANAFTWSARHSSHGGGLTMWLTESTHARLDIAKGEKFSVYLDLKGDF